GRSGAEGRWRGAGPGAGGARVGWSGVGADWHQLVTKAGCFLGQRLLQPLLIGLLVRLRTLPHVILAMLQLAVDALGQLPRRGHHRLGAAGAGLDAAVTPGRDSRIGRLPDGQPLQAASQGFTDALVKVAGIGPLTYTTPLDQAVHDLSLRRHGANLELPDNGTVVRTRI